MPLVIRVGAEICGDCITLEDGEKLHDMVQPTLARGDDVALDFEGVGLFASPFFNAAIGRLLSDISAENLNKHLKISNLTNTGQSILRRVIENSKLYYANPGRRQAADDAFMPDEDKE